MLQKNILNDPKCRFGVIYCLTSVLALTIAHSDVLFKTNLGVLG